MRPLPTTPPLSAQRPDSLFPSTSTADHLSLSLTIRHLPTDEWTTVRLPVEWRAIDLKRFALDKFQGLSPGHQISDDSINSEKTRTRGIQNIMLDARKQEKENQVRSRAKASADSLLSVTSAGSGAIGGSERDKKTPNGVKRFASALRDRLSSRDLNSIAGPSTPRPSPSPLRPLNASISTMSPLPNRHSVSTTPTPTSSTFNFDTPTRQRFRNSEDTHSRRSSMANFESLQLVAGRRKEKSEGTEDLDGEKEILIELEEASPTTSRRMERSKSLSEKDKDDSPVKSRRSPPSKSSELTEGKLDNWVLVNAVTGGTIPDHTIIGSKFVENDLLTLKPYHVLYDPPLELYHLPYLHLASVAVLPTSLATCRSTFEFSASSRGHSRRRSFGGKHAKEEAVDRRIVICVDDGIYAAAQGDREMTPGTTMVLKVIKVNQLEAIYPLPPSSLKLVASSSTLTSLGSAPPLPTSSSSASLANLVLPSGPANVGRASSPIPNASYRKKVKLLPLLQLDWEEGERLVLRAKDKDDHRRLMRILGEPEVGDEEKDERETQTRKDLVDLAFASRHNLLISDLRPSSAPAQNSRPRLHCSLVSHSAPRPTIQPRSVSDSSALIPPVPSLNSRDQEATPKRSSSVLHIRNRDTSVETNFSSSTTKTRTPSTTSVSTFSDSPSTPTSLHMLPTPEHPLTTKTTVTPAIPHSHSISYSPTTNPSPASLMSSSSSYFSLHSPPLVIPPFSYPSTRIPHSSSFTRAKSSLDLTSSIRSGGGGSALTPLSELLDNSTAKSAGGGGKSDAGVRTRRAIRRVTSALDGRTS